MVFIASVIDGGKVNAPLRQGRGDQGAVLEACHPCASDAPFLGIWIHNTFSAGKYVQMWPPEVEGTISK